MKFADTSVIVSLLNNEEEGHGPVDHDFIAWCDNLCLSINVSKTRDMIFHFRKSQHNVPQTVIHNKNVDTVAEYKYLGTIIDNKLCFEINTEAVCKVPTETFLFEEDEIIQGVHDFDDFAVYRLLSQLDPVFGFG